MTRDHLAGARARRGGARRRRGAGAAPTTSTAAYEEDGKWFTDEDVPTFKVDRGRHRRLVHLLRLPPLPLGVPRLPRAGRPGVDLRPGASPSPRSTMDYYDFIDVVVNGRKNGNSVMPSFGTNLNVMCYLDDIYVYLKAVGTEAIPRGRPAKRADKPAAYTEAENACMG